MIQPDFDKLAEAVRNWGRWGEDDQRGTLNHIGPEALKRGIASAGQGKLFSLGLNFDRNGPCTSEFRWNPHLYFTALGDPLNAEQTDFVYSDDVIQMPTQAATQWDALCHVHYAGALYNGCQACDTLAIGGMKRLGVENLAQPGIMSRGVLLDVARAKGVDILPQDYAISIDDLEQCCASQGVTVMPGDIVMVRTGHIARFTRDGDRDAFFGAQSGLSTDCAHWIHDKSVAAIASDNLAVEIYSPEIMAAGIPLPLHMLALRDMGCPLGEMFDLDALAQDCLQDGVYTCLLAAPPLAITGATGSPVNPLALK